ncbi:hypothetical protein V3C99_007559 [Haemonchus contortus]
MSGGDGVETVPKTSIHEAIIREVEEIDWSVDPTEEEGEMCTSVGQVNDEVETSKKDCDVEDDEEFDIDELECVDEATEEERRERRHEREERRSHERRKHSDIPAKYRTDRYHPYPRRGRFGGRRARDSYRPSKHHSDEERRKNFGGRSSHERSPRRHARDSSSERSPRSKRDNDEKDIPFEELEEVDCCDEIGEDGSDGASGTGESHSGEDDDLDDVNVLPKVQSTTNVDDDFPDLCEEIDADAMRRAAAAAVSNVVLFADELEPPEIISSPPRSKVSTTNGDSHRGDREKNGVSSRRHRTSVNGDRRDEVRRHHRHVDRDEQRSTRYSKTQNGSRNREDRHHEKRAEDRKHEKRASSREARPSEDRHHEKRASSREARPSTSDQSDRPEKSARDDTEIISVRGPLAGGWCQMDDEKATPSSSDPRSTTKTGREDDRTRSKSSSANVSSSSTKRRSNSNEEDRDKSEGSTKYRKTSSPTRNRAPHAPSPSIIKDGSPISGSPKKRDRCSSRESDRSSKRDIRSPPHWSSPSHQQQRNGTAIGVKEKIPSLLDMCINGLEPHQPSTTMSLIDSVIRDSFHFSDETANGESCNINGDEIERKTMKSRSLLDMDIPPPDRSTMRRYAVVLNSCELTKRRINVRTGNPKRDVPSKSPRITSPKRNDHHERHRQPRAYVHGVRK